jgi:hypothetical protein
MISRPAGPEVLHRDFTLFARRGPQLGMNIFRSLLKRALRQNEVSIMFDRRNAGT